MNNLSALGIPIALSYTAPSGITCSGSPAAPNFGGKIYATVNYTCKTASGVTVGQLTTPRHDPRGFWMAEGGAALACVFLFGMPGRRRKWQALMGTMALFVIAFGVTGCGSSAMAGATSQLVDDRSGDNNAVQANAVLAAGTYTVIVTGTAAVYNPTLPNTTVNVVHNIPLKIVVQ
jgi:trimeric autotransporter adhesin